MLLIDTLAYSSRLRHRSPGLKAGLATGALLVCVGAPSYLVAGVTLAIMAGLSVIGGGVPLRRYLALMAAPLSFLIPGTLAVVIQVSPTPLGRESLLAGGKLFCTALSAVSCLYFLSLTTPMTDILHVLRRARCPALIVELMFLIYRFLFVLLEAARAILTAQDCRLGNRRFKTTLRARGQLLAVLFQRAMFRSSLLYTAMESRCYDGQLRVLSRTATAGAGEKAAAGMFLALLAGLAVAGKFLGGV